MSPDLSAWGGATWIGGGDDDLVLSAQNLPIFDLAYTVTIEEGSSRAGFVFGANDMRLMDRYKNVYQLQNARDESYIEFELDLSGIDASDDGRARLNVYRVGYAPTDSRATPLRSFPVLPAIIDADNAHAPHRVGITDLFGELSITIDGNGALTGQAPEAASPFGPRPEGVSVNVNPMGRGGDYVSFGLLCDIGFAAGVGQRASFSDVVVSNNRFPHNALFREDLTADDYDGIFAGPAADPASGLRVSAGRYHLDGGRNGVFRVADPSRNSTPMLRTEFDAGARPIRDARLYVSARGIYEVYLNGTRVGKDHYDPGLTQYDKTQLYQTYDVTDMLKPGTNALGAMLGEGWWSGLLSFVPVWNHFGDRQSLLARLVVHYEDGSSKVVISNPRDWKYYPDGPLRYASLTMGEVYDADPGCGDRGLEPPRLRRQRLGERPGGPSEGHRVHRACQDFLGRDASLHFERMALVGQIGNSARVFRTLTARSVEQVRDGVYVYDMGQNMVGVPRVRFAHGKAGRRVVLRVAEMLYPNLQESGPNVGMVMRENYRAALSRDVYVMKDGDQVYQPRFTSHGYQYLEITGIDAAAAARGGAGRGHQLAAGADGGLRDVQPEGQPALVEPRLVQHRQLPVHSHGLPAAERAHGVVRGHLRLLAHRDVRVAGRPVPHPPHARDARRPEPGGPVRRHRPRGRGLRWRALGQRRHHGSLGGLPAVRGPRAAPRALRRDGGVHGLPRDDDRRRRPELGRCAG